MALNPNWPVIDDAWGPYWNCNGGDFPPTRFVEVTDRTRGGNNISRGRQYELDQVRSADYSVTLANDDAVLDPENTSGPFAGHIQPFQPYRKRAQWPPTVQLLTQPQASGGDNGGVAGASTSTISVWSATDPSLAGTITASGTAWQGSNVLQFQVPAASTTNTRITYVYSMSVKPGQAYALQLRVRNVTAATSVQVKAHIGWYTVGTSTPTSFVYGSPSTLAGDPSAAWTEVTVTGTAPVDAAGINVGVVLAADAAATCNVQVDGMQLEKGAASTAWVLPGVWYPMYAGWVERWPSSWDMEGTYGTVQPTAVDTFSLLSLVRLKDPLTQEIEANAPRFLFKLDDPAEATSYTDATGTYPAASPQNSKAGAGSLVTGTAITSATAGGTYTGSAGTVATFDNPGPGAAGPSAATVISLRASGITGPANPGLWTRVLAFRYTGTTPTSGAIIWSCMDHQAAPVGFSSTGSRIFLWVGLAGQLWLTLAGPTGAVQQYTFLRNDASTPNVVDGNWHLAVFGFNAATGQVRTSIDGSTVFYTSAPATITPTGLIADSIGAWYHVALGGVAGNNYKGDVSFAAEFPTFLSGAAISGLYTAWKSSCEGESSNARYARILRYAKYTGSSSLQSGLTTSMGPANGIDGQDALSALQAVVTTENGEHFVDRDGAITFKARSARYNTNEPTYVFGERTDLGEWPYEDCKLDHDPTHLANTVQVIQEGTGQVFTAQDATSIADFFPRTMERTVNASSALECQDAANYLVGRYKRPLTRVEQLRLHPSALPALWPVCLSLQQGTRVRIMRRPPGVPAIAVDCFVENLQWDMEGAEAWLNLQCSPADLTPYGLFAAWHTTLNATIASGVTSIVVNASQDTTNPLATQLAAGQQLVLEPGGANAETVTISAVGATSPGWTTATITLTAATTKSHTAGITVCEPLPAGVTDPATWDESARFDSIAFSY